MYNNVENRTFEDLPFITCGLLDLPLENGSIVDCSVLNKSNCIRCDYQGKFINDAEVIDDIKSKGHIICIIIWIIAIVVAIFATLGNVTIIIVLQRRKSGTGFDQFLIALAICDLVCSLLSILATTSFIIFIEKWNQGYITQFIYVYGIPLLVTAHSASAFVTVAITINRYLVIAFPIKFGKWFTCRRAKLIAGLAITFPILLGVIRLFCFKIVPNIFDQNIVSINKLDYIIVSTPLYKLWYLTLHGLLDGIDFCVPFPLLIIFNVLIFYHIKKFENRRKQLNSTHRRDIRAARIFLPVVIVLFLCNIMPLLYYYFISVNRIIYREIGMGNLLSYAVNSGVNLPIYYFGGTSFRLETKCLLEKLFPCLQFTASNDDIPKDNTRSSRSPEFEFSTNASTEFDNVRFS